MIAALGHNASFIVAAYLIAALIIVGLIAWVLLDYQAQRRALGEMEKRGVKRRSRRASRT